MSLQHNHGKIGAIRSTWRDVNLRNTLFRKVIETSPAGDDGPTAADKERWRELFWKHVKTRESYLRALSEYFMDNSLRSLTDDRPNHGKKEHPVSNGADGAAVIAEKATLQKDLGEHIKREAQIILLDLFMPNGKKLGQCTGGECAIFGGWLAALAKRVPAKTTVGDAMSEAEVRKIWLSGTF